MVHIFAADGKIYTSLDLKETDNKTGILTFNDGFRAYPVSQFWKNGNQATREGILNCVSTLWIFVKSRYKTLFVAKKS
nr:hypothetical protein [uncultured Campylobacter sp.]